MIPDLSAKRFVILGLQQSGKTVLLKHILRQEPASLVFDVLHEYQGFNRYIVKYRDERGIAEIEALIRKVIIPRGLIKLFAVDEANRYFKPMRPLPPAVLDLNDFSAHLGPNKRGMSWGAIARRPVQLQTDIVELSHYIFIFNLKGKNDIQYFDAMSRGLGDVVAGLPDYHFVILAPNRTFTVHEPVPFLP